MFLESVFFFVKGDWIFWVSKKVGNFFESCFDNVCDYVINKGKDDWYIIIIVGCFLWCWSLGREMIY